MLRAALRDLQWRWKRFVIAMVGVALVFAMGLIMTGLSESFSLEVDRTLQAIDAEVWAVSEDASGPFTSFVPVLAERRGPRCVTGDGAAADHLRRRHPCRHHRRGGRAGPPRFAAGR